MPFPAPSLSAACHLAAYSVQRTEVTKPYLFFREFRDLVRCPDVHIYHNVATDYELFLNIRFCLTKKVHNPHYDKCDIPPARRPRKKPLFKRGPNFPVCPMAFFAVISRADSFFPECGGPRTAPPAPLLPRGQLTGRPALPLVGPAFLSASRAIVTLVGSVRLHEVTPPLVRGC